MELNINHLLKHGEYRIERVLGQGGFGITYLAEQTGLARKVAVKEFFMREYCERVPDSCTITLGSSGSREMVDRFREKFIKEARAIARLSHKHIVRIIDVFEENNTAYYVMEYVGGGSLGEKSKGCALPEESAVRYIRQLASALDYVHSQRMMHLDVKPGNVLLNSDDEAVLIDFGLSKQYDMSGEQTSSTPVGISHGYAPLEQYKRGGVGTFSPATDIYSLGATLYRLLTGETPPEAGDVNDEGLPALPGNVSAPVRKAVEAAMQPRRKDRPQSIDEFIALLDGSSAGFISNVSEKSQTLDDDGETVVSFDNNSSSTLGGEVSRSDGGEKSQSARPVIPTKRSAEESQSVKEEILHSVQDDKGAKKDEPADRVISNVSEKSQNTPFNKKWLIIAAIAFVAVIFGVNWYGDYRAAEAERLQAEIALAEQQAEQQRLEAARLAQEEAARQAKEEADRIAAENKRKAQEEAARQAKEEADRIAAENKRKAQEEAERKRKEEAERKRKEAAQTRGTINGHDYVDLGLSVKWATCNVGASTPGDYGDHYAWGETSTKSSYDEDNSATYGKQMGSIAGNPTCDVACKKWGSPWRLPTKAEFDELKYNCTWTWTTQNGHEGYKVTSKKNGNSIFLPAAGFRFGASSRGQGTSSYYWSATPHESSTDYACGLYFSEGGRYTHWYYRYCGHSVRPVSQN